MRVWVHIADVTRTCRRDRRWTSRRAACDERVRAGRRRADAAAGAVQRRVLLVPARERLAVTVELELNGAEVVSAGSIAR